MDSDNAIKFSFAFSLSVLLHLLVIAAIVLGLSVEYTISVKKPIPTMQAILLDATQINEGSLQAIKILSQTEETRRAITQQRLKQVEKEKLLANAAQTMLLKAIRKKALEQQHALVSRELQSEIAANNAYA